MNDLVRRMSPAEKIAQLRVIWTTKTQVFDGNMQSLPWNFQYEDKIGRSVSTDSLCILEALSKVYGATGLADELERGTSPNAATTPGVGVH